MSDYEINPLNKPKPYMMVRLNDRKPDMIEIGSPGKGWTLLDVRAGPELVIAINELCRKSGHAYISNLGEQR